MLKFETQSTRNSDGCRRVGPNCWKIVVYDSTFRIILNFSNQFETLKTFTQRMMIRVQVFKQKINQAERIDLKKATPV